MNGIRLTVALAVVASLLGIRGLAAQQTPVRDQARYSMPGTGVVRGVVVADDASRTPLRRAIVTLVRAGIEDMRAASTDDAGRFSFADLPAGMYTLSAAKGGFITMSAGAAKPGMPGRQIIVRDGDSVVVRPIALVRGAAIGGRITDAMGQPLSNVPVQASRFITVNGQRRPRTGSGSSFSASTNDHGEYRVFGLPAGEYLVSAWLNGVASQTDATAQEIEFVQRPGPAGPTSVPPSPARPYLLAPTLYPGTVNEASATPVVVKAGEERLGIDISLQRVPVARVSGMVTDIDGKPLGGVQILRMQRPAPVFLPAIGFGARTAADGSFALIAVAPGDHVVRATTSGAAAERTASLEARGLVAPGTGSSTTQARWGLADVTVSGADIFGVSIRLQPGLTVSGQIVVKGSTPLADLSQIRVNLGRGTSDELPGYYPSAQADAQGRFRIEGAIPGRYRMGVSNRPPHGVLSALLDGRDVFDAPFDIGPNGNIEGIMITLTDARPELGGRLTGADGQPASHLYVLAFSQDRAHWAVNGRRIASARAGEDGSYSITGLPPGDYFLCALTELDTTLQYESTFLDELTAASLKITLGEGEKKVQNLRAGG